MPRFALINLAITVSFFSSRPFGSDCSNTGATCWPTSMTPFTVLAIVSCHAPRPAGVPARERIASYIHS